MAGNLFYISVTVALVAVQLFAGTSTRSSFTLVNNGVADSNLVADGSGVKLGEKYSATVKLFGDAFPGTPNRTNYPDIAMKGTDTLDVFFVDSTVKQVKTQRIVLLSSGVAVAGAQYKAFDLKNNVWYPYLHVDRGTNGFLASYILDTDNNNYIMALSNGQRTLQTDSSGTSLWISSTQCHLEADTFLVMSIVASKTATLHKVYSRGTIIQKVDSVLAVENASPAIFNGAVAVDSAGLVMTAFTRGTFVGPKTCTYRFFNRDLSAGPAGIRSIPIAGNSFYSYDDVAIVSYGINKFAMVSWDSKGVLLHTIAVTGGTVTHDTSRVITKSGINFCTIAASNRFLVIACMGDVDGNGVRCVEGIRYLITNGVPGSGKNISFSDPAIPVITEDQQFSSAMNATVDDSGTIGLVWRNQFKIEGAVWAHRPIRYEKAFYRSPVDSLRFNNDSIRFSPVVAAYSPSQYWNTESYLRFGTTVQACTTAQWISFTDTTILSQNRTRDCYYQSKMYLNRNTSGTIDSFATPVLSSYTVSWNVQPAISSVDSLNAGTTLVTPVSSGDTIEVIARLDSINGVVKMRDTDNGDEVTLAVSQPSVVQEQTFAAGLEVTGRFTMYPFQVADSVYQCSLTVRDKAGWTGEPFTVYSLTRNSLPDLSVQYTHIAGTGGRDSVVVTDDTTFVVQEEDTVLLHYSVTDSNDESTVRSMMRITEGENVTYRDSVGTGQTGLFSVAADTLVPVDTVRHAVLAADVDTVIAIAVNLIVNHRPVIADVIFLNDTLNNGDTTGVVLDDTARFIVSVHDTDCYFGDTLTYSLSTPSSTVTKITTDTKTMLTFVPDEGDTVLFITVVDRFERADSVQYHLSYPWFETGTEVNPGYRQATDLLSDSLSLISGSSRGDTVVLPVVNTGRDPLVISDIDFYQNSSEWCMLQILHDNDTLMLTADSNGLPESLALDPQQEMTVTVLVSAKNLVGDSLRYDTISITTNDPRHRTVEIPVRVEYNDLPQIVSIDPYFIADAPYRPFAKKSAYTFPPHARISISFSEPMDTSGVSEAITVYSIRDMQATGVLQPLPVKFVWLQNNTVVQLSPSYISSSPHFKLKPPEGLFIPTDSIALLVRDTLHDIATTPSGPNRLDVDRDFMRQRGVDTLITRSVDSVMFTIAALSPSAGDLSVDRDVAINIIFSTPFYAATVDTSLTDNRSFTVSSEYNNSQPLAFSSVAVHDDTVTFRMQQRLFYRDSLTCSYRSRWIRDSLGYAADNNNDGIDATIFDSLSREDDLQWGYRVRPVSVVATEPESAGVITDVSPSITVRFDGTLPPGVIDSDTSKANRSFRIGSGRTGYSALRSITYLPDSTGFVVQPRLTFFSNDSVYCSFSGFDPHYRYAARENYPDDTTGLFGGHDWYFRSGEIGFYTYPNPYKPSVNARHCRDDGPCGIWFKNLHTLGLDLSEVAIAIYTLNAHTVFDTRRNNIRIRFNDSGTEQLPQWKWDTRNARGDKVASGLYLYAVFDSNDAVLVKGKLIIVR